MAIFQGSHMAWRDYWPELVPLPHPSPLNGLWLCRNRLLFAWPHAHRSRSLPAPPAKAATVAAVLDEPKAREVMYRYVYGWFDRVSVGVYELSARGKQEAPRWLQ